MKTIVNAFMGCVCLVFLVSCDQSNQKSRDLTKASKGELIQFYEKLPDNQVKDIFVQQSVFLCVQDLKLVGVKGDTNRICTCVMNQVADNFSMEEMKKMMLPEHMLTQEERNEIDNLAELRASAMTSAVMKCK